MKRFVLLAAAFGVLLCGVHEAQAAPGQPVEWADLGWRTLNFILFVGILWWAFGKKLTASLKGRRVSIEEDLEHLETARSEAQQQLRDLSARIAGAEAEAAAILEESRIQAEAAQARIIEDAKRQAQEILVQARLSAENEAKQLAREVRAALADEVVDAVRTSLADRLDPAQHERLIANALKKVVIQ